MSRHEDALDAIGGVHAALVHLGDLQGGRAPDNGLMVGDLNLRGKPDLRLSISSPANAMYAEAW